MEIENPSNGESEPELGNPRTPKSPWLADEIDSSCSTPYASAPSSPGRAPLPCSYFFSAPASPMHFVLSTPPFTSSADAAPADLAAAGSFEFDFSATRPSSPDAGAMSSADELFHNGKIRPMKLSSHLQRPQKLAPLIDLEDEDEGTVAPARGREMKMRSRSMHRRARSMSPMRNSRWSEDEEGKPERKDLDLDLDLDLDSDPKQAEDPSAAIQPESASSSRSSSSGRNSKKWIFLKDLLYRSKSEGSAKGKEKFWHSISFSPSSSKEKQKPSASAAAGNSSARKSGARPTNGVGKPRKSPAPSAHERHYTAKRAQAEEMRKRTFLPYRQGLLGCLGFSSRSYGAMNGFARALNPVPSK